MSELNPDDSIASDSTGAYDVLEKYDFSDLGCGVALEYEDRTCDDGWQRISLSEDTVEFTCEQCIRGSASSNGAPCMTCPPGFFSPDDGQPQCIPCPPGYYQDRAGQSSCLPCDIYSFARDLNHTQCTLCGDNALTFFEASTSRDQCVCTGGYYGDPRLAGPGHNDSSRETDTLEEASAIDPRAICRECPMGAGCCSDYLTLRSTDGASGRQASSSSLDNTLSSWASESVVQSLRARYDHAGAARVQGAWHRMLRSSQAKAMTATHYHLAQSGVENSAIIGYYGNVTDVMLRTDDSNLFGMVDETVSFRADCRRGTLAPLPLPGYAESEEDMNIMIKCKPAEACVGVLRESDAAN